VLVKLKEMLKGIDSIEAKRLYHIADFLISMSVWALGGDGWAYDIGYGGLDHIMAQKENVNILVLDTEVYSNTGGQASKATTLGSFARFAYAGKDTDKKDMGLMAMTYNHVYVAHVSLSNPAHCIKTFFEAERYNGPSLIIADAHCIAHGIDMSKGVEQQRNALKCGYNILYRFNPELIEEGKNPLHVDTKEPEMSVIDFNEIRKQV